tara:strand:+ start:508 stop:1035 length:528 start_codon:yes stop_codon:yes gene_type:complete
MRLARLISLLLSLFIFFSNIVFAETTIAFVNVGKILSESKAGKSMASQIDKINKDNINSFSKTEEKLKKEDNSLSAKKNVLSKEDFQKDLNILKNNIAKYQQERQIKINASSKAGIEASKKMLSLINPILAKYANDNNISIIVDKKNIIMGKTELDITNDILKIVDKEIKPFTIK